MSPSTLWLRFTPDHPALAGHFPQRPIVPGALLLDEALHAIAQAADGESHWHIANVKFHRPVRPDEALRLQCTPLGAGADAGTGAGAGALRLEIHAAQSLVLSASIERRRA